jgi:hypothetical protein
VPYGRERDASAPLPRGRETLCPLPVRATIIGADARRVGRVDFFVAGRAVGSDLRAPYARTIARRHLRTKATLVRALVFLGDGQRVTLDRLARRCVRA